MDLHLVEDIAEITDDTAGVVRMISAAEAYRRFGWIRDAPVVNAVGNYRGMVISAQWKTVYVYSSSVADKAGNVVILLSVAHELIKSRQQIGAVGYLLDSGCPKILWLPAAQPRNRVQKSRRPRVLEAFSGPRMSAVTVFRGPSCRRCPMERRGPPPHILGAGHGQPRPQPMVGT